MSADNSYEARLTRLRNRTLAIFHSKNSQLRELGPLQLDSSTYLNRRMGQARLVIQPPEGPAYEVAPCCPTSTACGAPVISNFNIGNFDYDGTAFSWPVTWTPIPDTTVSFTVTPSPGCTTVLNNQIYTITGPGSATVSAEIVSSDCGDVTIVMTITSTCGATTTSGPAGVCFLAGARVAMEDGSVKAIEDVIIGDRVIGAFGEINTVLALHRPLLGQNRMCCINDNHHTSNHHPHVGANKEFFSNDIHWLQTSTYQKEHDVITEDGSVERRLLHGLNSSRIIPMARGVSLKTLSGSCTVDTLNVYDLAPDTQLYNLVVSGSHTYHVDGYAVTGWPREDDFDYDAWIPRG